MSCLMFFSMFTIVLFAPDFSGQIESCQIPCNWCGNRCGVLSLILVEKQGPSSKHGDEISMYQFFSFKESKPLMKTH